MKTLKEIEFYLQNNIQEHDSITNSFFENDLSVLKAQAIDHNSQDLAKTIWCYEQILRIQKLFNQAFRLLKFYLFYEAWCLFESIEISSKDLFRHLDFEDGDKFQMSFIRKQTKLFQSLFPYKLFASPGFIIKEQKCSICKKVLSIHSYCDHKLGEIYNGEFCARELSKIEILEVSLVPNPVQKYSVMFLSEDGEKKPHDDYDYSILRSLIAELENPYEYWTVKKSKIRRPHINFTNYSKDSECPCGSGKKYQDCCLKEVGVLQPHTKILLRKQPYFGFLSEYEK